MAGCPALWGDFALSWPQSLCALDLALWHHVGRSHAPAVLGAALTGAALLHLARTADAMHRRRAAAVAAALLALAALGYSSAPVFLGLFGAVLLALFAVDAAGLARADRPVSPPHWWPAASSRARSSISTTCRG